MPTRRALLLGGAGIVAAGAVGTAAGVEQGWLPGRPWVQAHLGLNGEAGVVPDIEPGPVMRHSFVSKYRNGATVDYAVIRPPVPRNQELRLVVALHGLGQDIDTLLGPEMGLDRFLAAHVADGGEPFAMVMANAGDGYYHPRPDGTDDGAMILWEVLPRLLNDHQARAVPVGAGFLGWSMGGYGALRLAALLGAGGASTVVASSPAIWSNPDDASSSGFDDAEDYEHYSLIGEQDQLDGMPVRIDIGTGDPFYRDVQDYVAGFSEDADVVASYQPGAHNAAYWRRMLPDQLAFLGRGVRSQA